MTEKTDGRRERSKTTRARVLEAAITIFAEHGYDAATIKQIAAAVGVRQSNLYYHFENKQDLLRQVVDWDFGRVRSRVDQELEKLESITDLEEYTRRAGSAVQNVVLSGDHRVLRILLFQSLKDPAYFRILFELFDHVFNAIGMRLAGRGPAPTDLLELWLDRFYFDFVPMLIFAITAEACAEHCQEALPDIRSRFRRLLEAHEPAMPGMVIEGGAQ